MPIIDILEEENKLMNNKCIIQLDEKNEMLRQAYFKAKYKSTKFMITKTINNQQNV